MKDSLTKSSKLQWAVLQNFKSPSSSKIELATLLVLLTFRVDIPGVFLRQRAGTLAWDRWCHVPRWRRTGAIAAVGDV